MQSQSSHRPKNRETTRRKLPRGAVVLGLALLSWLPVAFAIKLWIDLS